LVRRAVPARHINTFADTTYQEARDAFGSKGAKLFAEAVNKGFGLIKQNIRTYKIACDFQVKKGFVYAENKDQVDQLEELCQGMHSVGLTVNIPMRCQLRSPMWPRS